MFLSLRRVILLMFLTVNLHALTVESFVLEGDGTASFNFGKFEITGVELENNILKFPLEKDEHKNIALLTKEFYKKLESCFAGRPAEPGGNKSIRLDVTDIYKAGKIYLARVSFDDELLVTFIVSDNKYITIRRPSDFIFKDKDFETALKSKIKEKYLEIKNESGQ